MKKREIFRKNGLMMKLNDLMKTNETRTKLNLKVMIRIRYTCD